MISNVIEMRTPSRGPFPPHDLAQLMPAMTESEYDQLCDDIAVHGLRSAIVLFEEQILDGRHRERACRERGVEPRYETFAGTRDQALAYVISTNIHRRHLTPSQCSMIAARLATMKHGDNQHGQICLSSISQSKAANMFSVSIGSIKSASIVIARGTPELAEAVEQGKIAVSAAAKLADQPEDVQREAVADPKKPRPRKPRAPTPVPAAQEPEQPNPGSKLLDIEVLNERADMVAALMEKNPEATLEDIAALLDTSAKVAITTRAFLRGREAGMRERQLLDYPETLPATQRERFESSMQAYRKRLEREFTERLQQEAARHLEEYLLPTYTQMKADADKIVKSRKGVFKQAEWNKIIRCLHPDASPSQEQKGEAFALFNERKLVLLAEADMPTKYPPLPATVAELLARKKTKR